MKGKYKRPDLNRSGFFYKYNMKVKELDKKIGKIFIDLDGVLVGCLQGVADYYSVPLKTIELAGHDCQYWLDLKKTSNIKDFFANLPWEPNGEKLLQWFDTRNIPYEFLTKPTGKTKDECISGKKIWLKNHGLGHIPVIFSYAKQKYSKDAEGNPNILIDDMPDNIKWFNGRGGIGLLYNSYDIESTLRRLEELL